MLAPVGLIMMAAGVLLADAGWTIGPGMEGHDDYGRSDKAIIIGSALFVAGAVFTALHDATRQLAKILKVVERFESQNHEQS